MITLSFSNVIAQTVEKPVSLQGYYILPVDKVPPELQKLAKELTASVPFNVDVGKRVFAIQNQPGAPFDVAELTSRSGSHDTFQLQCYRCALGQNVGNASREYCQRDWQIWDADKTRTKALCK